MSAYTEDADGWWWGYHTSANETRISVYSETPGTPVGSVLLSYRADRKERYTLANNYLNLLKVQQSAT